MGLHSLTFALAHRAFPLGAVDPMRGCAVHVIETGSWLLVQYMGYVAA